VVADVVVVGLGGDLGVDVAVDFFFFFFFFLSWALTGVDNNWALVESPLPGDLSRPGGDLDLLLLPPPDDDERARRAKSSPAATSSVDRADDACRLLAVEALGASAACEVPPGWCSAAHWQQQLCGGIVTSSRSVFKSMYACAVVRVRP
jgi:hypothetical protein